MSNLKGTGTDKPMPLVYPVSPVTINIGCSCIFLDTIFSGRRDLWNVSLTCLLVFSVLSHLFVSPFSAQYPGLGRGAASQLSRPSPQPCPAAFPEGSRGIRRPDEISNSSSIIWVCLVLGGTQRTFTGRCLWGIIFRSPNHLQWRLSMLTCL